MSSNQNAAVLLVAAHAQTLVRQVLSVIAMQQVVPVTGDDEEFVLSAKSIPSRQILLANMHSAMTFVEELFAVRLPHFVIFGVIFTFGLVLASVVPLVFEEILQRFRVANNYRACVRFVLQIGIFVFGTWLALAAVGIDFFGIVFSFGVVGLVISTGLSPTVANVFGGIMIQTDDLVQRGHDVTIIGIRGIVVNTSLMSVTLRRVEDGRDTVKIPNSVFSSNPIQIHREPVDVSVGHLAQPASVSSLDALKLGKQR